MAYQEGQTATGPNGEKIVFRGGQWQSMGAPAVSAPAADPVIARDPYKVEDQQMQRNADARAERSEQRQEERFRIQQEREDARDARQAQKDAQGGVEQTKAKGFLTRGVNAEKSYSQLGNVGARSLAGQAVADNFPNAANYFSDADRQRADQAQREFIAAVLRYDSGAAIPPEEFVTSARIYFPQPGDGPEVIEQKARARRVALQSLKDAAGPAGSDVVFDFDAPASTNPSDADAEGLSYANEGVAGGVVTDETPGAPTPDDRNPSGLGGLGALARQGLTLGLADEAAGVGGYLASVFTGEDPQAAYERERDIERRFVERARGEWGMLGTGAELLGGGGAARLATIPTGIAPVVRQGAGLGALGGFGYGEGAESPANALIGAAGGAALGAGLYGAGMGINALSRARAGATPDMAVVQAGQRQNIPIRQPDARPALRNQMAQTETTQTGGPIIREARAADEAAIEGRIAEIGGQGAISDPYALGTTVQGAGQRYIARSRQQANRLYERARQEAAGATVQPTEAIAAIDQNIAELTAAGANSNRGQIAYLQGLKEDLSRPLSIEAVQNLRTNMRGQLSERGLTGTDAERRVAQVIDAANTDLARELPQSASQALRAADDFYKQRQEFVRGTLKQFMGDRGNPLPAETAAQRLMSMTQGKGNYDRFSRIWKELEPSEQADVAATIASSLGRKANGEFSAATLIRSLDPSKGINPRTARLIFGKEGADALNDLRIIARAKTDTGQAMNNSRTGVVVSQTMNNLKTMLLAAFGFSTGGAGGAAAGAISREFLSRWGEQRAARMLLNPDFAKWLKNAPNTTSPRVIDRYFSRLAGLGSIAANDNQAFTNALIAAVRQSPGRAAAEQETEAGRVPPQQ